MYTRSPIYVLLVFCVFIRFPSFKNIRLIVDSEDDVHVLSSVPVHLLMIFTNM